MERLWVEGISWPGSFVPDSEDDYDWVPRKGWRVFFSRELWRRPSGGHGGDEYGNCSLYFRCPLFGIVWFYPTGHFQRDVEMPDPGTNAWVDRMFYNEK